MSRIFALAPLLTGIMRKVKARTQKRVGASVLQPYYDLLKLLHKDEVVSDQASWVFSSAPWVVAVSTITAALFVPVFLPSAPSAAGDFLLVLGLFALARFFTMLAGIDAASAFGGIGTSREMMMSSLAEPGLFLTRLRRLPHASAGPTSQAWSAQPRSRASCSPPSMLFGLDRALHHRPRGDREAAVRQPCHPPGADDGARGDGARVLRKEPRPHGVVPGDQAAGPARAPRQPVRPGRDARVDGRRPAPSSAWARSQSLPRWSSWRSLSPTWRPGSAKWRLFRLVDLFALAIASGMVGMILFYL